jgi:hypothetical protein
MVEQYPIDNKMMVQSKGVSEEMKQVLLQVGCKVKDLGSSMIVMFPSEWTCDHKGCKATRNDGKVVEFTPRTYSEFKPDSIFFGIN